jgi:hypothetical protein
VPLLTMANHQPRPTVNAITNPFTARTLTNLIDVCERHGATVDNTYSGRGMFGATCIAVYCERGGHVEAFLKRSKAGVGRVDGMGLGGVVHYWPSADTVPAGAEARLAEHMAANDYSDEE